MGGKAKPKFKLLHEQSTRKIADLIPYAKNSRTHSKEQISQIKASMFEFGFTIPVLIDEDDQIIAGHGRIIAAGEIGIKVCNVIIAPSDWTEDQKRAYVIMDNQLTLNGGWDFAILEEEVRALEEAEWEMDLLGFDEKMLEKLLTDTEELEKSLTGGDGEEPEEMQKVSYTLHPEQYAIVDDAELLARTDPLADTGLNDNARANALALICTEWLAYKQGEANGNAT